MTEDPDLRPDGGFSMRGHSVGGFGSVTTNKVIATIAGNVFGKDVQAYPKYGSEKKGLPTTYYLTIADTHIYMHSELEHVDLRRASTTRRRSSARDPLDGLVDRRRDLHAVARTPTRVEVWKRIPDAPPEDDPRQEDPRLLLPTWCKIAREVASVADLQMRMQGIVLLGAFLKLTPYAAESEMTDEQVYAGVEKALRKYFGKRGDRVVQDNINCVKRGYSEMQGNPAGRSCQSQLRDGLHAAWTRTSTSPATSSTRANLRG